MADVPDFTGILAHSRKPNAYSRFKSLEFMIHVIVIGRISLQLAYQVERLKELQYTFWITEPVRMILDK